MHEYQNIQTRMLGADSFPYRNITVDQNVFESAVEALNGFFFIGLQEVYDFSIKVFLHEINRPNESVTVVNERDQGGVNRLNTEKSNIRSNAILREKAYKVNSYDVQLYNLGFSCFFLLRFIILLLFRIKLICCMLKLIFSCQKILRYCETIRSLMERIN